MKLAIVGSRSISHIDIGRYLVRQPTVIISGGARGIDTFARQYALSHAIPLQEFLPDYTQHGQRAPLVRNELIVQAADAVLALWDGESTGTLHTINLAIKHRKHLKVVIINQKGLPG